MRSLRRLSLLLLLVPLIAGCARKAGTGGAADSVATADSAARRPAPNVERVEPAIRVDAPEPAIPIDGDSIPFVGSVRRGEHGVRYRLMQGRTTMIEGTVPATAPVEGDTSGRLRFEAKLPKPKMEAPRAGDPPQKNQLVLMVTLDGSDTGRGAPRVVMPLMTSDTAAMHTTIFNLYWRNPSMGDPKACDAVVPVKRVGPKRMSGRAMLIMLTRGPSPDEKSQGYRTEFPPGAVVSNYKEEKGVVFADFNAEMNRVSESCARTALRTQIEQTLRQLPGITSIELTVEGKPFQ